MQYQRPARSRDRGQVVGQSSSPRLTPREQRIARELEVQMSQPGADMSPKLATERLVLRRFTGKDAADLLALVSQPSFARATPEIEATPSGVKKYIELQNSFEPFEQGKCFDLAIERISDSKVLGLVTLVRGDHSGAEIGYALGVEHRGQGYATEAAKGLLAYGFRELRLHRVKAATTSANIASRRVLERLGMREEGQLREATFSDGEWLDDLYYGILAHEWENANGMPQLETGRLVLRGLHMDDAEFVLRHFGDPSVTEYLLDEEPLTSEEQARDLIRFYLQPAGKTHNRWGIVTKAAGVLIGTCGFHKWDKRHRRAEIGYDLTPSYWGQGIMTEALLVAIEYGFGEMDLNRIDALVYSENARSARVLEKLGFQKEGLLREYYCIAGERYDHLLFSLLEREWRTPTEVRS
jgi:ribosomal-protein-alanine N-acetyltransferase